MLKQPKLAIVIPYYKIDYFKETLDSLRNQSNKNFTLYIGNDNSPYNPEDLVVEYSDIISKYHCFSDNIGHTYLNLQWNRCIDELVEDEEWIMVLCDDDFLENNYVESFYNHVSNVESLDINLIRCATKIVDQNNTRVLKEYKRSQNLESSIQLFEEKLLEKTRSSLSEYIFKKVVYEKFKKFKSFECSWGSDNVAWLEFSDFKLVYCINDSFMFYRSSPLSVSGNSNLKGNKMKGELQFLNYILSNYSYKFTKEILYVIYERYYHYYRSLNRKNDIDTLRLILEMMDSLGFVNTFKILKYNKDYFQRIFQPS